MRHLSLSNVIALLALFAALGGGAWALAADSVKSKHIVDGTVTSADLKDGHVTPLAIIVEEDGRNLRLNTQTTSA